MRASLRAVSHLIATRSRRDRTDFAAAELRPRAVDRRWASWVNADDDPRILAGYRCPAPQFETRTPCAITQGVTKEGRSVHPASGDHADHHRHTGEQQQIRSGLGDSRGGYQ